MAVAFPAHVMALSKVQRLYDACDVVFASPAAGPPTLGEIRWLQKILGEPLSPHPSCSYLARVRVRRPATYGAGIPCA